MSESEALVSGIVAALDALDRQTQDLLKMRELCESVIISDSLPGDVLNRSAQRMRAFLDPIDPVSILQMKLKKLTSKKIFTLVHFALALMHLTPQAEEKLSSFSPNSFQDHLRQAYRMDKQFLSDQISKCHKSYRKKLLKFIGSVRTEMVDDTQSPVLSFSNYTLTTQRGEVPFSEVGTRGLLILNAESPFLDIRIKDYNGAMLLPRKTQFLRANFHNLLGPKIKIIEGMLDESGETLALVTKVIGSLAEHQLVYILNYKIADSWGRRKYRVQLSVAAKFFPPRNADVTSITFLSLGRIAFSTSEGQICLKDLMAKSKSPSDYSHSKWQIAKGAKEYTDHFDAVFGISSCDGGRKLAALCRYQPSDSPTLYIWDTQVGSSSSGPGHRALLSEIQLPGLKDLEFPAYKSLMFTSSPEIALISGLSRGGGDRHLTLITFKDNYSMENSLSNVVRSDSVLCPINREGSHLAGALGNAVGQVHVINRNAELNQVNTAVPIGSIASLTFGDTGEMILTSSTTGKTFLIIPS